MELCVNCAILLTLSMYAVASKSDIMVHFYEEESVLNTATCIDDGKRPRFTYLSVCEGDSPLATVMFGPHCKNFLCNKLAQSRETVAVRGRPEKGGESVVRIGWEPSMSWDLSLHNLTCLLSADGKNWSWPALLTSQRARKRVWRMEKGGNHNESLALLLQAQGHIISDGHHAEGISMEFFNESDQATGGTTTLIKRVNTPGVAMVAVLMTNESGLPSDLASWKCQVKVGGSQMLDCPFTASPGLSHKEDGSVTGRSPCTNGNEEEGGNDSIKWIAGISVLGVIIIVLLVVLGVVYCRCVKPRNGSSSRSDNPQNQLMNSVKLQGGDDDFDLELGRQ